MKEQRLVFIEIREEMLVITNNKLYSHFFSPSGSTHDQKTMQHS